MGTEENDLLMPNLQLMPKLSHGTMLDTTDTHTLMGDTDTHMLITTLEKDLLMLNQKLKVSHGMDMGTVDMVMDIILTAMDTVVITMDKPLFLNLAIFEISLIYLNFKMTVSTETLANKRGFMQKKKKKKGFLKKKKKKKKKKK